MTNAVDHLGRRTSTMLFDLTLAVLGTRRFWRITCRNRFLLADGIVVEWYPRNGERWLWENWGRERCQNIWTHPPQRLAVNRFSTSTLTSIFLYPDLGMSGSCLDESTKDGATRNSRLGGGMGIPGSRSNATPNLATYADVVSGLNFRLFLWPERRLHFYLVSKQCSEGWGKGEINYILLLLFSLRPCLLVLEKYS